MYEVAICPSSSLHRHPWLLLGLKSKLVISMKGQRREEKRMNGGRNDPYYRSPRTPMAYRSSTRGNVYVLLMQFREEQRISLCVTVQFEICVWLLEKAAEKRRKTLRRGFSREVNRFYARLRSLLWLLLASATSCCSSWCDVRPYDFWNGVMMMYLYQPE